MNRISCDLLLNTNKSNKNINVIKNIQKEELMRREFVDKWAELLCYDRIKDNQKK